MCFAKLLRRALEKQTKSFKIHDRNLGCPKGARKMNITPKILNTCNISALESSLLK